MIDDKFPSLDAMRGETDPSSPNYKSELLWENSSQRNGLFATQENKILIISKDINFTAYSAKCDTILPQDA